MEKRTAVLIDKKHTRNSEKIIKYAKVDTDNQNSGYI